MKNNQERKWQDLTLKSLKAELRRLADVQVPHTLEARLLAGIPKSKAQDAPVHRIERHTAWDFGVTAAAAVLIVALMLTVNYGLSVPSQMLLTDLRDTSLVYARWDQNNLFYDQNNTLIGDTDYTQ
ncbi:MAG: hypothetical protein ACYS29_10580 [Planctomycetota bacterium]|jgi:hypothetical protein